MQQNKSEGTNKTKSSEGIKKVSSVHVEVHKDAGASGCVEGETDTEDDEVAPLIIANISGSLFSLSLSLSLSLTHTHTCINVLQ